LFSKIATFLVPMCTWRSLGDRIGISPKALAKEN